MTLEPEGGVATSIPSWAYWTLMAVGAALPVVLASELLPGWLRIVVAACNAAIVALVGSSAPERYRGRIAKRSPRSADREREGGE